MEQNAEIDLILYHPMELELDMFSIRMTMTIKYHVALRQFVQLKKF